MKKMQRGRPTTPLILSDEQREILQRWVRRPSSAQALAMRSRIVLACASGQSNTQVAREKAPREGSPCSSRS